MPTKDNMNRILIFAVLLNALSSVSAAERTACTTDMFEFKPKFRVVDTCSSRQPCPQLRIVGEIINNCAFDAGIKVRIVARNKAGEIVNLAEGWPNSVKNLPAKAATPFTMTGALSYEPQMVKFESSVIDVREWKSRR